MIEKIIEQLWLEVDGDCVPCECGIECPLYDYDENEGTYCRSGQCVTGMALLIENIIKKGEQK